MLLLVRAVGDHTILGTTLDDALGEAYDKTARLLGIKVGGERGKKREKKNEENKKNAHYGFCLA